MKVSWIKNRKDKDHFRIPQALGLEVRELENLEDIDITMKEAIQNGSKTIFVTNEVAGFSQDMIKTYPQEKEIRIIIV